jgi:hypothetical protein
MYREGFLILGIILAAVGAIIGFIPPVPDVLASAVFWIGIVVIIIWVILYVFATYKSGA